MGLFDFASTVLTSYKADTKDQKRKIRELSGEERKLAKAQLDRIEKTNEGLDNQIEVLGKVAIGLGGVAAAWAVARKGLEDFQKESQLLKASAGANIDALQTAAGGLITELEALEFASAAMNGAFAISQEEMEDVVRGMTALRAQGNDFVDVQEKVRQAIVEGNVEPLKEFGVIIETTNETVDAHTAIINRMRTEYNKMGGDVSIAGDEVTIASNQLDDSMRRVSIVMGEVAVSLAPVISGLAGIVEQGLRLLGLNSQANEARALTNELAATFRGQTLLPVALAQVAALSLESARARGLSPTEQAKFSVSMQRALKQMTGADSPVAVVSARDMARMSGIILDGATQLATQATEVAVAEAASKAKASEQTRKQAAKLVDTMLSLGIAGAIEAGEAMATRGEVVEEAGPSGAIKFETSLGLGRGLKDTLGPAGEALVDKELLDRLGRFQQAEGLISRVFGTPEELDALALGMSALQDVTTAAFGAWIDGTMGVGEASKKAIGGVLKALAMQFFSLAVGETAKGVAALFLNPAAAANHFAAAGLFSTGAVVAGAAARELGQGGGPSGRPGARGAAAATGGVANVAVPSRNVFIVADDFADTRSRAARVRSLVEQADRFDRRNTVVRV